MSRARDGYRPFGGALLGLLLLGQLVTSNIIPHQSSEEEDSLVQGFYTDRDYVHVLNDMNFTSTVLNSGRAWVVEFYNSWCGFCRRFAPVWKALGKSVDGWKDIVAVGAINCAEDLNYATCRDYEILGYPTVKFFHAKSINDELGVTLDKDFNLIFLRHKLIDQLIKDEESQESGPNWPNLVPYRNSEIKALWEKIPDNILYQFLIFEEPTNSYLGAEVILDLHRLNSTRIRKVTKNNLVLTSAFNIKKYPTVVVIERNDKYEHLKTKILTREEIVKEIVDFLKAKGVFTEYEENQVDQKLVISTLVQSLPEEEKLKGDKLYQLDLEAALQYSLNNEIPLSFNISGEKMTALKMYLKVLVEFFPAHLPKTKTYLEVLQEVVEDKSNMTGKEFKEQVKLKEKGLGPIYSAPKTWIGCKGSLPNFRGYPCGLWTLFHTLTVAAAEAEEKANNKSDVPSVLVAMHGYIKNFFGCSDCAQHFQKMAAKRKLFKTRSRQDDVLWLWQAHNEVNIRLVGDESEDPNHKKIKYPASRDCRGCRSSDGVFHDDKIYKYLMDKYSKANVDLRGIDEDKFHRDRNRNSVSSSASYRKLGWDFTIFDFSICVVLYVASAAILILVCLKFAYKRTSKKKISFHNLFGLV